MNHAHLRTRFIQTRMTTFIKTKLNKSDDQTNIDKYRVKNNTEYHIISKLIFHRINVCKNICINV